MGGAGKDSGGAGARWSRVIAQRRSRARRWRRPVLRGKLLPIPPVFLGAMARPTLTFSWALGRLTSAAFRTASTTAGAGSSTTESRTTRRSISSMQITDSEPRVIGGFIGNRGECFDPEDFKGRAMLVATFGVTSHPSLRVGNPSRLRGARPGMSTGSGSFLANEQQRGVTECYPLFDTVRPSSRTPQDDNLEECDSSRTGRPDTVTISFLSSWSSSLPCFLSSRLSFPSSRRSPHSTPRTHRRRPSWRSR